MEWTILGSGGCTVIPKPLCGCRVCEEAREKGVPYARTGPSAFLHDIHLLLDTPAEIAAQLNRERIGRLDYLAFTHLDPDHVEGLRVVEQVALDFRTWRAHPSKQIRLLLPHGLEDRMSQITSQYGSAVDFYRDSGFVRLEVFEDELEIDGVRVTALPVDRGAQLAYIYVFQKAARKVVYAPCDVKPFPEDAEAVQRPDLLFIQPGMFETGLANGFKFPADHISRTTLYTFQETLNLAARLRAQKTLFLHLEEYWNRSHDDYRALEAEHAGIRFAYDGMQLKV
jgi:phosphoribosyl 1,2-cyclic phosphate phosphodiesterase